MAQPFWTAEDVAFNRRFLETMRGFLRSTMNALRETPVAGAVRTALARAVGHIDRVHSLWGGPAPALDGSAPLLGQGIELIGEAIDALSDLLRGREQERSPEAYTLIDARDTLRGVMDGLVWLCWFLFGNDNIMTTGGDR